MKYLPLLGFLSAFVFASFAGVTIVVRSGEQVARYIWRPLLVCKQPLYDLGELKKGESRSHDFIIENNGTRDLRITSVTPGCKSCIEVVKYTTISIAPGESGTVRLRFLSKLLDEGEASKAAVVKSNDPNNPFFLLRFRANVRDDS